ncbi:hypothetical protein CLV27_0112 [Phorcysia thermohydrogeniphila]|uniref:Uncharacterized protein n=1 Tax=Phorcysia thermohydrogeniphila TaxID=936138 RepID=A0A4R1GH30_9BACT|nr:hypothetical protein CLV27_0112 [Phorcysia thermohydrogeniphila]
MNRARGIVQHTETFCSEKLIFNELQNLMEILSSGDIDFQYFQIFAVEMPEKVDGFCFSGEEFKGRGKKTGFIFSKGGV